MPPAGNDEVAVLVAPQLRLGDAVSDEGHEEGVFAAGDFERLLLRLYAARFTGLLEVSEEGERSRIFFEKGRPCAARASARSADLGRVVVDLGLAPEAAVDAAVEEARRSARMLGNELTRSGLLDTVGLEVALREQLVRRAVAVGRSIGRSWVLSPSDAVGLPGSSVHPAAILYRLESEAPDAVPVGADARSVSAEGFAAVASAADPSGALAPAAALVGAGARLSDVRTHGGAGAVRLVAWLVACGDARLAAAPAAPVGPAVSGQALEARAADIDARYRALPGATHYSVLGVAAEDDGHAVVAASEALAAVLAPDALPASLDGVSRRRAAEVRSRVLEAARILGDPDRRGEYDRRMADGADPLSAETSACQEDLSADGAALLCASRAQDALRRGAFVRAASILHGVARGADVDADVLAMLGWARHLACPDDPSCGEAELRRALALDAHNEVTQTWLGRVLLARGARDEARTHLRGALALNHAYTPAREALRELER